MAPRFSGIDSVFMSERVVQLWKALLAHSQMGPHPSFDQFNLKSGRITR
jgi:hypothetical protein